MLCFTVSARKFNALSDGIWRVNFALCTRANFMLRQVEFNAQISRRFESRDLQLLKLCDLITQCSGLFKLQCGRGVEHLLAKLFYDLGALGGRHLL